MFGYAKIVKTIVHYIVKEKKLKILSWEWWKNRPKKWFSYGVLITVAWLGFLFFRVVNWTKIIGKDKFQSARKKRNNGERRNVVIVSNHRTMFDSFIIGIIAYFPEMVFWPSVAPYHFAAQENFFKYSFVKIILNCLNALPVKPGRKDPEIMKTVLRLLPKTNIHIFPGGRRSYQPLNADPAKPVRGGIGYIITNAPDPKPLIIPVWIGGVEKIFGGQPGDSGRTRWFPRLTGILRRPTIIFGDPIEWQFIVTEKGNTKAAWLAIADLIAGSINKLDPEYESSK